MKLILGTIAILSLLFVLVGCNITGKATINHDEFAKCLTEKGAKMYGSDTCSHCSAQKRMFGDSFQYVDYTECSTDRDACREAGVRAYPTWIIDGKQYVGQQKLYKLAGYSMCTLEE